MDFLKLHPDRLRRAAASAILATFVLLCQPTLSLAQVNSPTWMADSSDYIANIPLKGIAMLGSHDASMYIQVPYSDFTKNQVHDYRGQLDVGVRYFDMRIARLEQITNYGYVEATTTNPFSLVTSAIPLSGSNYYLYGHGGPDWITGVTLPTALDQISQWLDQHPKEIVILQLVGGASRISSSGYPNANPDVNDVNSAAAFEAVLDQHLRRASDHASYIYDLPTACALAGNQYTSTGLYRGTCSGSPILPQEVTPQQLWTTSARVVLLSQFSLEANLLPSHFSPQLTWVDLDEFVAVSGPGFSEGAEFSGSERLTGYFGNGACDPSIEFDRLLNGSVSDNNKGLSGYRPDYQSYESDDKFLTQQAELTPYSAGINALCAKAPLDAAYFFNPQLNSTLQTTWQPYSVNIVTIDRSDDEAVLANVIAYNQRTFGRAPSGNVTPTQVTVGRDGNVYKVAGGQVWKRTGFTGQSADWTLISLGSSSIYRVAVDTLGRFIWIYSPDRDIATGTDGAIYYLNSAGNLNQITIAADGHFVYTPIPGVPNLVSIAAGPANTLTATDTSGTVWRYASNGNWTNLNNNPLYFRASSVTVDAVGNVWATERETTLTTIYRPLTNSSIPYSRVWSFIGGHWGPPYRQDGVQISAGGNSNNVNVVYALSHDGLLHNLPYNTSTGLGAQAPPPTQYAASVSVSGLTFNHARQVFTGTLTVTNTTGSPITDQLAVTFDGLPDGVTIANNPLSYQELPFILMPTVTLQPGESTSAQVEFSNPNLVHINYLTEVYAYVAGS